MSDVPRVEVRDLGKDYRLGELVGLKRTLEFVLRRGQSKAEPLHALSDVSFDVWPGECVGLLGANGSGKSTVLKIIAGITLPTAGRATLRGRVVPLLEVEGGFHPDLTGRENILLFGTLLGIPRSEILEAEPRIAAFGEIESHLDTPVKRYSIGMQARLSLGIAMCLSADIYVLDEVFAVVDDRFRARCMEQIQLLLEGGASVLLVSHNLELIEATCNRGVWLENGRIRAAGPIDEVAPAYAGSEPAAAAS